jgi:hypothetical protein
MHIIRALSWTLAITAGVTGALMVVVGMIDDLVEILRTGRYGRH